MIGKWAPVLLTTSSLGGGIWYSLSNSEYKIYSITNSKDNSETGIYKKDFDILRKRNSGVFGLDKDKSSAGVAWKASVEGNVYRDESYFVFDDWSFLNGVQIEGNKKTTFKNGAKLKSYVDGVGLKIEKIKDDWKYNNNSWERTRKLDVKRVLMKNGYQFEVGKGTCLLTTNDQQAVSDSNLYLLIGFAEADKRDKMSKPSNPKFVSGQESFCEDYQKNRYGIGNQEISISFDVENGEITEKVYPILAYVDNSASQISPIYWNTKSGTPVNSVVLAVAIKGKQLDNIDENGWEILTKEKAIKDIQSKIRKGEIIERHSKTSTVGFQLKQKTKLKGVATEGWKANAEITFR